MYVGKPKLKSNRLPHGRSRRRRKQEQQNGNNDDRNNNNNNSSSNNDLEDYDDCGSSVDCSISVSSSMGSSVVNEFDEEYIRAHQDASQQHHQEQNVRIDGTINELSNLPRQNEAKEHEYEHEHAHDHVENHSRSHDSSRSRLDAPIDPPPSSSYGYNIYNTELNDGAKNDDDDDYDTNLDPFERFLDVDIAVSPNYYNEIFGVESSMPSLVTGKLQNDTSGSTSKTASTGNERYNNDFDNDDGCHNDDSFQDNDQIHDQLPHIDTYKTSMLMSSKPNSTSGNSNVYWFCPIRVTRNNTRDLFMWAFAFIFTVLFFMGIGMWIGVATASSSITPYYPATSPTTTIVSNGDNDESNGGGGGVEMTPTQERFRKTLDLIGQMGWSSNLQVVDPRDGKTVLPLPSTYHDYLDLVTDSNIFVSSQYRAAYWVSAVDRTQVDISISSIAFLQRYVLLVLFYSLGGDDGPNSTSTWYYDYNFASEYSECDWYKMWEGKATGSDGVDAKHFYPVGVLCDGVTAKMYNSDAIDNSVDDNDSPPGLVFDGDNVPGSGTIVERLYIPSNNMQGTLPSELRLLSGLKEINFYNNKIIGTIPSEYSQLINLRALVLHSNNVNGTIPLWFDQTPYMEVINLGSNKNINGTIPFNLNRVTNLTIFNCESCSLSGNLRHLDGIDTIESIHLGSNQLSGSLDDYLFDSWLNIIEFDVGSNRLEGTFPSKFLKHPTLKVLDLHNNKFSGNISTNIGDISSHDNVLEVLAIQNNELTGPFEPWITHFQNLRHLDISSNKFSGTIPTGIGSLTDLRYLYIAMLPDMEQGTIPTEIGFLTDLQDLSFQSANLTGPIPTEIINLERLILFDMNRNQLTGTIPSTFGTNQPNLRFMLLSQNQLSGPIPDAWNQLKFLDTLLLNSNANISSNVGAVCAPELGSLRVFNADCKKFTDGNVCARCTCCDDDNAHSTPSSGGSNANEGDTAKGPSTHAYCSSTIFYSGFDPSSEYHYSRRFYQLNEDELVFPVYGGSSTTTTTTTDSEEGMYYSPPSSNDGVTKPNETLVHGYRDHEEYMEDGSYEIYNNTHQNSGKNSSTTENDADDINDPSYEDEIYEDIFGDPIVEDAFNFSSTP